MEAWQLIGVAIVSFMGGLAFSISVFYQFMKDSRNMRQRLSFLEKNMAKAITELEGWEDESIKRKSKERI